MRLIHSVQKICRLWQLPHIHHTHTYIHTSHTYTLFLLVPRCLCCWLERWIETRYAVDNSVFVPPHITRHHNTTHHIHTYRPTICILWQSDGQCIHCHFGRTTATSKDGRGWRVVCRYAQQKKSCTSIFFIFFCLPQSVIHIYSLSHSRVFFFFFLFSSYFPESPICPSGGINLARGYLKRPDLNADRFVTHPQALSQHHSRKLYKTGKIGRYMQRNTVRGDRRAKRWKREARERLCYLLCLYMVGDLARILPGGDLEVRGRSNR